MIARLTGTLAETSADGAVIDVGGVGYQVLASARTLDALGPVGGEVLLLTEMQVREDSMTLFGFATAGEREAFRALTSVQGVGGRVALAILSALGPDELSLAVSSGDKAMIARANGVGPKLAQRIANELQGKLGAPGLAGTAGADFKLASASAAAAFAASLDRTSRTLIVKFPTRFCSRAVKAMLPATISTSSGFENQGVLFARFLSSSDTRSFDCATPVNVTSWLTWRIADMNTPSGSCLTTSVIR